MENKYCKIHPKSILIGVEDSDSGLISMRCIACDLRKQENEEYSQSRLKEILPEKSTVANVSEYWSGYNACLAEIQKRAGIK